MFHASWRVRELEQENRRLRLQLEEKDKRITALEQRVQDFEILVSQLQAMLFKKKRVRQTGNDDTPDIFQSPPPAKPPRIKESYRRPTPPDHQVTRKENHTLTSCQRCQGHLEEQETRIIYTEDIPEVRKEVIKHTIHVYTCLDCQKQQSAIPIPPGQMVRLGPRVKRYILYYTYVLNTSYRDIIRSLQDYYRITVSPGEIQRILQESAAKLTPHYNGIHQELLEQESLNMDETGWKIRGENNYLWHLGSPTTTGVLYHVGSRGKGNAEQLLKDFDGCLTTDCYGAYKNLKPGNHQICWVHLLRNMRELCAVGGLPSQQRQSAHDFYRGLLDVYQQLRQTLVKPYHTSQRARIRKRLLKQLRAINVLLPDDTTKKLKNLKLLTQEYERELFTCLDYQTALPENNLAERNLRHVVLKRKRSFGSQTEKGARIFAINCSVVLTLWKRFPQTFLLELANALED